MPLRSILGWLVAAGFCLPAAASVITLTFEGVGDNAQILNFYNGGTDSAGHSGTNFGVQFASTAIGLFDANQGSGNNFINEPTPKTAMGFTGSPATMNYAAGFTDGFSFYYSSNTAAFVDVYSNLDGLGTLLAHITLGGNSANACSPGPNGGSYCHFDPIGASFNGIARSVNFGGAAGFVIFDNITLGSSLPGPGGTTPMPEPTSVALVGLALAGLAASRRKTVVSA